MGRWEPNARDRLGQAALELFLEAGYENTTAAQIAARAGLAKSSFFRHFADKREVLFAGHEVLNQVFAEAIAGAPESAGPVEAVGAALEAVGEVFSPERLLWARGRNTVVTGVSELRERELLKQAGLVEIVAQGLARRGVGDPVAALVAGIGILAFHRAFERWVDSADGRDFAGIGRAELAGLVAAAGQIS